MTTNLSDRPIRADMTAADCALVDEIAAMDERDGSAPDPGYVTRTRGLLTLAAAVYGAARTAQAVEDAESEHGGLLLSWPPFPPRAAEAGAAR